jgi:hypothetical protein
MFPFVDTLAKATFSENSTMRGILLTLSTVCALAVLAAPADAQISFSAQGALITGVDDQSTIVPGAPDLNNTYGLGARVGFKAPLFPIGVVGQGVYYFPDGDDFSYSTYSIAARYAFPSPIISPYGLGGWQWRRSSSAGASNTESGAMLGLGVEVNLGISLFLEANWEFHKEVTAMPDFDNDPIVIKAGITFG